MAEQKYVKNRHDIGITYEGNLYGLMLADTTTTVAGKTVLTKSYQTVIDEYLAEQMFFGAADYRDLPPEKELAFVVKNHTAGFGEDVFDSEMPDRYFSSTGCDLRHKNRAMLSWGATGIAVPSTTAPTAHCTFNNQEYVAFGIYLKKLNATGDGWTDVKTFVSPVTDMKLFGDGFMYIALQSTQVVEDCEDDWVDGAQGASSLDTTDYKVGSGSVKIVKTGTVTTEGVLAYENITSLDFSTFTGIKLWIKASSAVAADDLRFTLSSSANGVSDTDYIHIPALTAGVWTRVYARLHNPASDTAIISVNLMYYANAKANTIWLDDIEAEESYWYMDTGESFTQSTLDVQGVDSFAKCFGRVGNVMWKTLPPHNLYSSTDPSNTAAGNWSGVTIVSSPIYEITSMVTQKNSLFITKGDKAFYAESGGNVEPLIEETSAIATSTGGKNSISWKDGVYMPYGTSSLLEYDSSGSINWIDPSLYCSNLPAFDGQIQALAGDEQWLYAIVDNDTKVEILAGRNEATASGVGWVWHPYQTLTLTGCGFAFISNVFQKRLYICSTSGSESMYYIPLPLSYGNIASDTNRSFLTGGYFETPELHLNFEGDNKGFIKLTLNMEDTTSTVYWTAFYKKRGDSSYTTIGTFKVSPSTTWYIPVDSSGDKPVSTAVRFKFSGTTGSTSSTPILNSYDIRAILYPSRRNIILCTVRCADNMVDKKGLELGCTAKEIKTWLEAARDATWPVTIKDIRGATKTVRVLPTNPFSKVIKIEKDLERETENIEEHVYLALQEIQLS